MPEQESQSIIDQLFHLLEQLLLPNWTDLIALIPWVLIALVIGWLLFTARQWQRAGSVNRPRVAPRLAGGAPPPGVHLPGPSRWPFVVPIGAFLLLLAFALAPRHEAGNATLPFQPLLFGIGMVVTLMGIAGWLRDAMREWRTTEHGGHGTLAVAGAQALPQGYGGGSALVAAGAVTAPALAREAPGPQEGIHMPAPSPWPFFAPIAFAVMLLGLIFSAFLLLTGIVLGVIAAAGWLLEAGHEWRTTDAYGHAIPATRDPAKAWPRRLVPVFVGVIAIGFLVTLAPHGLGFINSLTPPSAAPTAVAVPAVPEISASTAVSFETGTLVVPAGRPFDLVFDHKHPGVPHNVKITDTPDQANVIFNGEIVTGPAQVTYKVPAIAEGDRYFLCEVHPNMKGTLQARPEGGGPPGGDPGPGGAPAPSAR
jgi:plastocyanin